MSVAFSMRKALVTGGAGFVGLEVARQLLAEGEADITVFSRNPSARRLGDLADMVTAVAGDVGNFSHVLDVVKASKPRVIYHLGAMLSAPSDADPASAIQTNAMGTFYILEAARLFDVEQVIFSSSVGTYGYGLSDEPIDDMTIQRPKYLARPISAPESRYRGSLWGDRTSFSRSIRSDWSQP